MPTHKVKNGYQWGKSGKVYPTKKQADKQGQAIYASGWKEKNKVNESFTPSKLILIGILKKVSNELYDKGYNEDVIDNYINNENMQLDMNDNGYIFSFNGQTIFHIDACLQLDDVINNASQDMIQWFENNIKNVKENKNMSKKQLIRLTEGDLHNIIKESVNKILKEAFSDVYQPHNFKDINDDYYSSYIIVDGTRAVVGNYDNSKEAIEDARKMASRDKYGTYEVYGCDDKNSYALEEDYPEDNTLVYSTDEDFA